VGFEAFHARGFESDQSLKVEMGDECRAVYGSSKVQTAFSAMR